MAFVFQQHYTRDEARSLLPQIREWLSMLQKSGQELQRHGRLIQPLLEEGHDVGGLAVGAWVRTLHEVKCVIQEFQDREIQIKDLERGLIDFPSLLGGREVFLCWEQDEDDIEYWHELDTGYSGREKL